MKLSKIIASVETENQASLQILNRAGFTPTHMQFQAEVKNGKYIDLVHLALHRKYV